MIFIDRTKVPIPDILKATKKKVYANGEIKNVDTRSASELKRNIERAEKKLWKDMTFSVYTDAEVKDALIKLFEGKCAYCESKFLHVYIGDVEHFRPKGRIAGATIQTHGYYWLAADWDNLLLSCRNCNQVSKQSIYDEIDKRSIGKLDKFPLREGEHIQCHTKADEIKNEKRLLLNPCKENPEEYFSYDESEGVIKPKHKSGEKFEMAETSIEVYALQRVPLVQARQKLLIDIKAQKERILEAIDNYDLAIENNETIEAMIFETVMYREFERLKKYRDSKNEFAGFARFLVDDFIDKLKIS